MQIRRVVGNANFFIFFLQTCVSFFFSKPRADENKKNLDSGRVKKTQTDDRAEQKAHRLRGRMF